MGLWNRSTRFQSHQLYDFLSAGIGCQLSLWIKSSNSPSRSHAHDVPLPSNGWAKQESRTSIGWRTAHIICACDYWMEMIMRGRDHDHQLASQDYIDKCTLGIRSATSHCSSLYIKKVDILYHLWIVAVQKWSKNSMTQGFSSSIDNSLTDSPPWAGIWPDIAYE